MNSGFLVKGYMEKSVTDATNYQQQGDLMRKMLSDASVVLQITTSDFDNAMS